MPTKPKMDTFVKFMEIFVRLSDERQAVAIEIMRCIAEGKTSDNPQIAAFMARQDQAKAQGGIDG